MALHVVGYIVPLIVAALAIPMFLGRVPPNDLYGYRTRKTHSSPEIWYEANRVAGRNMFVAGVLALAVNLSLWALLDLPEKELARWMSHALTALIVLSCVASYLHVRKL